MTIRTRRTFFYFLIVIFALAGVYLLFSAQGWVLDLKTFRVVKTGSLFLKYIPSNSVVEINGEITDASPGLLTGGTLISKLIPGNYEIKISEAGYLPWEKQLQIKESLVTEASQIKLWPEDYQLIKVATSSISNFWLTGAGAILQNKDGIFHLGDITLRGQKIIVSDQNFSSLISLDGKNYFMTELENPEKPTNISLLFSTLIKNSTSSVITEIPTEFFLHPFSGSKIIVTTKNSVYILDLKKNTLNKIISAQSIISSTLSDNEVFVLDAKGTLRSYNLFLQTSGTYTKEFPIDASIKASPNGSFIFFLRKNGELTKYNRASETTTSISKNAAKIFISADERKVIILSKNGKLSVLVLLEYYTDGKMEIGETWTIPSGKNGASDFYWLSIAPNYGLVLSSEKLFITELDKRTPQNIYPVTDSVKKLFIQGADIYILKTDGILYQVNLK